MRPGGQGSKGERPLLLLLLAVGSGTLMRIIMSRVMFLQADEEIFSYDAYYVVLGRSFSFMMDKIGAYILYPYTLAGWFTVLGTSLFNARLLSVLCFTGILVFVFLTVRIITGSGRAAFAGTILIALLPYPLRYGHIALSEPLAWLLISASFYLMFVGMKGRRWYFLVAAGALSSVAFFCRRSALVIPLVMVPALMWTNRDRMRELLKQTGSWLLGYAAPFGLIVVLLLATLGWDRLSETGFTFVPNITSEWEVDLSESSDFDNALYTLKPTIWKSLPLFLAFSLGAFVLLLSLFRDRWKAVYLGSYLWPVLCRTALDGELHPFSLAMVMVAPLAVTFLMEGDRRKRVMAVTVLLFSVLAFTQTTLSGDLWNVIIYCSAGAVVILYLEDRIGLKSASWAFLAAGICALFYLSGKETQVSEMLVLSVPLAGIYFLLGLVFMKRPDAGILLTLAGIFSLLVLLSDKGAFLLIMASILFISVLALAYLSSRRERIWAKARYVFPVLAIAMVPFIPDRTESWAIVLTVLICITYLIPVKRLEMNTGRWTTVIGAGLFSLGVAFIGSDSLETGFLAMVLVLAISVIVPFADALSVSWKRWIGEQASIVLFLLVMGYLAFYVYYNWTEVYMMELLFPAGLIGGFLLWTLVRSGIRLRRPQVRIAPSEKLPRRRASYAPRTTAVAFSLLMIASIPLSVDLFLVDEWFHEESMDKRPYMRTILEVADWIEDHTDADDKVLAWHCYAVEADRETIIEVSNAAIYNGAEVIGVMEEEDVDVFVRCWYTDNGLWRDQPLFQEYIQSHFTIDRVIDGNECWLRMDASG